MSNGLVNADEIAALLSVPKSWVMQEARAGRIPHVKLGRYTRFDPGVVAQWWETRRRGPWRKGSPARASARATGLAEERDSIDSLYGSLRAEYEELRRVLFMAVNGGEGWIVAAEAVLGVDNQPRPLPGDTDQTNADFGI